MDNIKIWVINRLHIYAAAGACGVVISLTGDGVSAAFVILVIGLMVKPLNIAH